MKNNYYSNSSGVSNMSILTVLQIIFIVLKLCGLITWSWFAVLIPTWIVLGLVVIVYLVVFIYHWHETYKKLTRQK